MTSVVLRAAGSLAAVTALVAGLTACGSGPSQINTAVIIDDRTISVDDVQGMLDKIVAEQPAAQTLAQQHKLDLVAREVVSQLVTHELLTEVAREDGISVDPAQRQQFLEQNPFAEELAADGSMPAEQLVPQLVYRARGVDAYVDDQLLLATLANEYLGRSQATYNIVAVPDADTAKTLAEDIAAQPERSAQLMEAAQSDLGPPQLRQPTGGSPNGVLLTGPDNAVYVFPPIGDSQSTAYQVVHVLSTEVSDTAADDFDPSQIDPSQLPSIGRNLLRPYAIEANIEVSPRFGVWNFASMTVVPKSEADASELVVLPESTQP